MLTILLLNFVFMKSSFSESKSFYDYKFSFLNENKKSPINLEREKNDTVWDKENAYILLNKNYRIDFGVENNNMFINVCTYEYFKCEYKKFDIYNIFEISNEEEIKNVSTFFGVPKNVTISNLLITDILYDKNNKITYEFIPLKKYFYFNQYRFVYDKNENIILSIEGISNTKKIEGCFNIFNNIFAQNLKYFEYFKNKDINYIKITPSGENDKESFEFSCKKNKSDSYTVSFIEILNN